MRVYRPVHAAVLMGLEVLKLVWLRALCFLGWGAASMGNRVVTNCSNVLPSSERS